jgi:hypothetical protein
MGLAMIKREELANLSSCMNRAHDDEMMFVLLGRDVAAPAAIWAWIEERIRLGKNKPDDEQLREARRCITAMLVYQEPSSPEPTPEQMTPAAQKVEGEQ